MYLYMYVFIINNILNGNIVSVGNNLFINNLYII